MFLLVFLIARSAPLLLVLSVGLVAGRFLHDRWVHRSQLAARAVFAAVLLAAAVAMGPYAIRSVVLLRAELAAKRGAWAEADRLFVVHQELGGLPSRTLREDWITALLNVREWNRAEALLLTFVTNKGSGTVRTSPRTVLLLGICRYNLGRLRQAEQTLRAVSDCPERHQRDYFLGRLAEARSDRNGAMGAYRRSLAASPRFLPALYQSVRLALESGDAAGARELLASFARAAPEQAGDPALAALQIAAQEGRAVPAKEFYIVER